MITPSRRTHQRLIAAVDAATAGAPRILWDGTGDNPYPDFLAHADALIVTADSVNMTGEACATGRPVYVFEPSGRFGQISPLSRDFEERWERRGRCRDTIEALPDRGTTRRSIPPVLSPPRSSGGGAPRRTCCRD